ncbi:MAG: type IX secretion system outer membrane channel protein PorV [Dyadobacter sp.]|uniref:type IX secretion system outer membrane channel protein PorV n=1 Tax=Dyadobacter sp. TaxID=1914288 RepID=UPI001B11D75E|nr:type IX secretion system outer membrane channel protein PorV [Dyadobacter sp.]MBO9613592.1 type IX secretion system outer membrane channel protein PorV [Dyadobacter sp.]
MKATLLTLACLSCAMTNGFTQTIYRVSETAGEFLVRAPDARAGGMGHAGTATSGDANSAFWNVGKLTDAPGNFGASATYSPWMPYIMNNVWLGYATGYKKLGKGQVVGASVQYFNEPVMISVPTLSSGEDIALSGSYAKQLGGHFSAGVTLKYVSSNLGGNVIVSGNTLKPARAVAGDIGFYYKSHSSDVDGHENMTWTAGATLVNIGPKMSYGAGYEYFLPTTLRLGGGLSYTANGQHKLNVTAEAGKLLVPTPVPGRNVNQKPYLEGILQSFSDAPGGFKEEMQEIVVSMGAEYWYRNRFALRGGYHAENKEKGNRKFFTTGAGVRFLKHYSLDFAYLIPTDPGSAMKNMYKVSASVDF